MEGEHGVIPFQIGSGLQTGKRNAVPLQLSVKDIEREYLFHVVHCLHLIDKGLIYHSVREAFQFCAVENIAHIGGHKASHHTDDDDGRYADEQEGDILGDILVVTHVPGGQSAFIAGKEAIKEFQAA